MSSMTAPLAYLTDDIPGIGGAIKQRHEDFLVEELPAYEPSGEGEHLYLYIEKRGQTTTDVARRLAKMFGVRHQDVGFAGLKDKHAVTRQLFSLAQPDDDRLAKGLDRFEHTPFSLLWHDRHRNKIKRGHLRGNRFVIYIRDVDAASVVRAKQILDRLLTQGVPNFFGDQRFGYRQQNHLAARAILREDWREAMDIMLGRPLPTDPPESQAARTAYDAGDYARANELWSRHLRHDRQILAALVAGRRDRQAIMALEKQQRTFLASALQSAIFNHILDQRLRGGRFDQLVPGDLAWKHDSRAVFAVDEAVAQTDNAPGGRVERMEVSPSGPMWGPDMTLPAEPVLSWERAGLEAFDVTQEQFNRTREMNVWGTRRSLRIPILEPQISAGGDERGPFVRLAFELPRGSFATIVLREIMKSADASAGDDTDEA